MSSPSFKELKSQPCSRELYIIEHEMMNESNVKNAIMHGHSNQHIVDAYKVSALFVYTCRKELVIDGRI